MNTFFSTDTLAACARRARVRHSRPAWLKLVPIAIVVIGLFLVWRYTPLADYLTARRVYGWARAVGGERWSIIVVIAAYTLAAFLMFPRPLLTLFAVIAYGPWLGAAFAMIGIIIAAFASYSLGRALPKDTLRNVAGERFDDISKSFRGHGIVAGFAVSIAPVGPFPVVGMMAGAARIKAWHYLAGTALGMAPGTLATTIFGEHLADVLEDPSTINYWYVAAVVLVFAALIVGVRWWLKRQAH
jgi:uncharacterized membrane protein YdjX (TVP38/TMEM64 family)